MRFRIRPAAAVAALGVLLVIMLGCSDQPGTRQTRTTTPPASAATGEPVTGQSTPGKPAPPATRSGPAPLTLVAIGDSIPYNSPGDCVGCTSFVDRYGRALERATGRDVMVKNLSGHNGLTLPMLLEELPDLEPELANADAIIVAASHNSILLNEPAPCGTRYDGATGTFEDWTKVTRACAKQSAARFRDGYDQLHATIASWRSGKPTLLLTVNKYNDWLGDPQLSDGQERRTIWVHDAWNEMICTSAEQHGFLCADIYHAFNGRSGDRFADQLLTFDRTHPSDEGNALIARVLVKEGFGSFESK